MSITLTHILMASLRNQRIDEQEFELIGMLDLILSVKLSHDNISSLINQGNLVAMVSEGLTALLHCDHLMLLEI